VYEVASFYSMFNLRPVGRHVLEVCRTARPACSAAATTSSPTSARRLGIHVGETTKDGLFTLKAVECLGSCGTAPMLQCGAKYHERLTPGKVDALLEKLRTPRSNHRPQQLHGPLTRIT
jgi:NADH-quinone oxidoreductase subunit E